MLRMLAILVAVALLLPASASATGLIFSDTFARADCQIHPPVVPADPAHTEECLGWTFAIDPDTSEIFTCNGRISWLFLHTTNSVGTIKDEVRCRLLHRPFSDAGDFNFVMRSARAPNLPFEASGSVVWIGDSKSRRAVFCIDMRFKRCAPASFPPTVEGGASQD